MAGGRIKGEVSHRLSGPKVRTVRDIEVIDSELGLLLAIRHMVRDEEGRPPSTARIDELLDERSAATVSRTVVFSVHSIKGDCDGCEV